MAVTGYIASISLSVYPDLESMAKVLVWLLTDLPWNVYLHRPCRLCKPIQNEARDSVIFVVPTYALVIYALDEYDTVLSLH